MKNIKLILVLQLLFCSICMAQSSSYGDKTMIRSRESFNENWLFKKYDYAASDTLKGEKEEADLYLSTVDDQAWRTLDLPHDWGIEGPFDNSLENNTGLLPWKGIGWYRKHFNVEKTDQGKRIYIDFDGAMANAQVWLNGKYVGQWPYGYTSFRFDLTPYLTYGAENVIAVRLNTRDWDSRWYPGAGIYRNVWLTKTNHIHIGQWGVHVKTPEITDELGKVSIEVDVENHLPQAEHIEVRTTLYKMNASGAEKEKVGQGSLVGADITAYGTHQFRLDAEVVKPVLWDVQSPELYMAETVVLQGEKVLDRIETNFGFRTLEFTAKDGFHLNGKRVEIKGVCNHHDLGPLGAAFNVRAAERQLELLKEMGCNAIRTSHNPPAPELLDLCDKMGFLVQVEAFDSWRKGKLQNDYNQLFDAWHDLDLRAMIRRDRNHPSVFMWSTGNEIPDQWNPTLSKILTSVAKSEDDTRPITVGCNWGGAGLSDFQKTVDVFGYNYNLWMYKKYFNHEGNSEIPTHASETSSCLSSRGEYFFPVETGDVDKHLPGNGIFQVSSYDVVFPGWGCTPDKQFKMLKEYPQIFGEFVWTGFDYLGEPTPYNNDVTNLLNYRDEKKRAELKKRLEELGSQEVPSRSSYFGIMDLCGFKKDRFFLYQSHWRPDYPMAHILPHWNWAGRIGEITPVHVYTSGDEAELFLNGQSLGRKKKGESDYRLKWDEVIYQPGELKVVAYKNGEKWAEDRMQTTSKATNVSLSADRLELNNSGEDLAFITVKVEDKKGRLVPRSHNNIQFEISGPGEIVAVGNGNAASHESFQTHERKVFNGMCLVIVKARKDKTGQVVLKAKSKGLRGDKIVLNVK